MDAGNFSQFDLNAQLMMMINANQQLMMLTNNPGYLLNPSLLLQQPILPQLNVPQLFQHQLPMLAPPTPILPPPPPPIETEPQVIPLLPKPIETPIPTPIVEKEPCCSDKIEPTPSTSCCGAPATSESNEMKPIIENPALDFEMGSLPTSTYYPTHFMRGTKLQMANGSVKKVEDVSSDDFLRCAAETSDTTVNASIVASIIKSIGSVTIVFRTGLKKVEIPLRVQSEQPFFVLGKGWSSCNTKKTADTYGLNCYDLEVGDVCIVMTRNSEDVDAEEENAVVDIISAERQYEVSNEKASWREDLAELYYEHVHGRVSAPPERILSNPPPPKRRRTSESSSANSY